ncbi:TRAP transporter substrate-binding protein DctP [Bacillus sp. H-16]|uniref:TRAP transporter substrate-binding protein DctP n=1 Tax=Alteribacter salitolerans TaxID=2912333 RepID=UPI0019655A08|nr:TRAP transporter substrate-binding protein DctP [Alteribacter salitolerans]MBM7097037.1 TRAP transporter substrate-binding protein DctP [Alteribacter salitolerans]
MSMKRGLLASGVLSLGFVLAACGSDEDGGTDNGASDGDGDETYELRFATEEYEGQLQYEYAREFAELLEEKTDGRITTSVYEFGGLGSEVDQFEMIQNGGVEFAIVSPGFTGTTVREGQLFALQFLFSDDEDVNYQVLNESEALNEDLAAKYEERNVKPLAFWSEGGMQWTGNRELREPSDFEGFRMRTQESSLILRSYEAYGADPTPLSWAELYSSLQLGNVDGQENPIFFIEDANFHEVQDHMTISDHNIYVAMTTVNADFYNDLPDDLRQAVDETVDEMRPAAQEMQLEMNEELLTAIEEDDANPTEIYTLSEEERNAFRELAIPMQDYFRDDVGEDGAAILDKLLEEIEEAEGN